MYFLIYASTAARPLSEADLLALLSRAQQVNAEKNVTGMLLYSPGTDGLAGTFVQVLEGVRADVQALYLKIKRDERHRECTVLQEGDLFLRRFGDWTMGFRDLSSLKPSEVPGFSPIYFQNWTLPRILAEPDPVLRLLYSFAGN